MAEMQIAMRLTLADFATGPLAEFMAKLQGLQAVADKVNASDAIRPCLDLGGHLSAVEAQLPRHDYSMPAIG